MNPSLQRRVLFIQPFGLNEATGGSRILSSMIKGQPFAKRSIHTGVYYTRSPDWMEERHLPIRFPLGKLDRSRLAYVGDFLEIVTRPFFEKRLAREIEEWQPDVVHIVPHWSCDFHVAWKSARSHGCRVVMSVHDELNYTLSLHHPFRKEALKKLGEVWRDVDQVFSITQELGDEYASRYGARPFEIITDGVAVVPDRPVALAENRLNIYFMGMFHYNYRENLRALTQAIAVYQRQLPGTKINLLFRCGHLEKGIDTAFPAQVLPFADHDTVLQDMSRADLLYMPLPFGKAHEGFTRYSLSTKMVSYLGSGVPILFHGPEDSAAGRLLSHHQAAFTWHSLSKDDALNTLGTYSNPERREEVVMKALELARTSFPLDGLRHKFFQGLLG